MRVLARLSIPSRRFCAVTIVRKETPHASASVRWFRRIRPYAAGCLAACVRICALVQARCGMWEGLGAAREGSAAMACDRRTGESEGPGRRRWVRGKEGGGALVGRRRARVGERKFERPACCPGAMEEGEACGCRLLTPRAEGATAWLGAVGARLNDNCRWVAILDETPGTGKGTGKGNCR